MESLLLALNAVWRTFAPETFRDYGVKPYRARGP